MKKLIFTAAIYLSLLVCYCLPANAAVLLDRVVAKVNDEVITWSELRRNIENDGRELLKGLDSEEKENRIKELEKEFLVTMIDLKLQLQEARRTGFDVSSSEIDSAVDDIKRKYGFTDEELVNTLENEGFSLEEYRNQFAEQILLAKIVNYMIRDNIFVSDSEMEEYYRANRQNYADKEKIKLKQILIAADYGDDQQKTRAEALANEIMKSIEDGRSFSGIMEKLEKDNMATGGDLGYLSVGGMIKEIREAVSDLGTGQVSKPFWSPAGLHILKAKDRVKGINIKDVRDKIKDVLFQDKFRTKYEGWIKSLKENASVEMNL